MAPERHDNHKLPRANLKQKIDAGLQRRRGGNKSVNSGSDDQSNLTQLSSDDLPNSHKIAYDPKDLANSNLSESGSNAPFLTLMEEVLLIGLKDKEGYLSFWNDNISYTLRGLILMELAFRGKISMVNDPVRRRFELSDRLIEVVDDKLTGEVLLDEALKLIKSDSDHLSINQWIDLLSGETWNLMKINYQLKQVRERLAKGLVDKGILRTERKNFLLFDMATHPINDFTPKKLTISKILNLVTQRNFILESDPKYFSEAVPFKNLRVISLVCGCYAANVLENVLLDLTYDQRDKAFNRADELIANFSVLPFENDNKLGIGLNLKAKVDEEIELAKQKDNNVDLKIEVIAAVINVFSKMDSII
ncbi:hypothetical protein PACTADRAFT_75647 [Pachysolen tannophilus NRRL Y-2460]|uniref:Vacuolar protein sorting-associated protein 74 n=1 Tax=Pachysolen tannophilus NRRL Y-2460 TaxID=669874 RepID=A0A1E4TTQ3_PACTA|nr:hypothetical protein PACTADRAFT_75647 [Pachysolen tannophilus NRRL Y-2460]